jgi:glutamate carboxypeptidase
MASSAPPRFDADVATALLEAATRRESEMVDHLMMLAQMESPSSDPAAQQPVLDHVEAELTARGARATRRPGAGRSGGTLVAALPASAGPPAPFQLVIGHSDTVWPHGTTTQRPPTRDGDLLHGPGTYDMKAGLVQVLAALDVLAETGHRPSVAPVVLVNSDEEIGSRESTELIRALAAAADRVMVLEPSLGTQGALKTARKGLGRYTVTVHGKAAHAGLDPAAGASAILELSNVIQRLFDLNDHDRGVTVNVGMVSGGIQPNVIAPESSAVIDVRVLTREDAETVDASIRALRPTTPGTSLSVDGGMGRPPLERTERNAALYGQAVAVAAEMGIPLTEATAGGGSDGNTASQVAPTLDGLGAVGDGAHAEHERVYVPGWVQRTALLAGLLLLPAVRAGQVPAVDDPLTLVPRAGGRP